jgi:hypothetical protein
MEVTWWEFWQSMIAPVACVVVMAISLYLLDHSSIVERTLAIRTLAAVFIGALSYLGCFVIFFRSTVNEFLDGFRAFRRVV